MFNVINFILKSIVNFTIDYTFISGTRENIELLNKTMTI